MTQILHFSDLHLGKPETGQLLDAHKSTLAGADRRAEKDVLLETISALGDAGALEHMDAVVISGDLTNRARADGFTEFAELGETLARYVERKKIVVVPGNHDVPQAHGPDDPARYDEFRRVTRGLEFATPLLDGIDFDIDGRLTSEAREHGHLIQNDRFVILPLNSSHFCWGVEPLPDRIAEKLLSTTDPDQFRAATEELRRHDIPRVSNAQMAAIQELLAGLDPSERLSAPDRVVIGVLHHQLLPVSSREEFKSFESLTNLGAVREFLASLGAHVVLHGHKHESALYWDYIADPLRLSTPPTRVLVNAAPGKFRPGLLVARILKIGHRSDAPDIEIEDVVAAERRAGPISHSLAARARLWETMAPDTPKAARVVRGHSASQVYARVQSLFDGAPPSSAIHYLVCEIEDPRDAATLPVDYPIRDARNARQAWMTDLVQWWQLKEPQLGHGVEFNHGERIYKRWGNQVAQAASLLTASAPGDAATTRASILLLDPRTESSPLTGEFPSFVSVQLQLTRKGTSWQLECTGSFRKQEMRYWWPINVAELHCVQRAVAKDVTIDGVHPRPGLLRTVTAHAIAEDQLPVVAVPAVDRAVDQRPQDLWLMAYSLIDPEKAAATDLRAIWRHYLEDLRPTGADDEVPAWSRRGLERVLASIDAVPTPPSSAAVQALRSLVQFYGLFRDPSGAEPAKAREEINQRLNVLDGELDALFPTPTGGSVPAPDGN
jgi:3',5'-cyclic AMP phosphodiesterase CpdA